MASIINPVLAQSLIQEYQTQNASVGGPALVTPDGQHLIGYFIDRQSLDAILSNANFVGISVTLAKNPNFVGSPNNVFTIVFAGAELNPQFKAGSGSKMYTGGGGDSYEYVDVCPTHCS